MWAAFDARPRMPLGSFVAPELTNRLGYLLMVLSGIGLAFGALGRWWRRTVLLSAALALTAGMVWSEWQAEVFRFSFWTLAPLAAVGLTFVAAPGPRPLAITLVLSGVALTETIVNGSRALDTLGARDFRDGFSAALEARARSGPVLVVAEDTRLDSALVPWIRGPAARMCCAHFQEARQWRARTEQGRLVLAGPVARRHLELAGVTFGDGETVREPIPFQMSELDGTLGCATVRTDRWSQLPGVE